MILRVLEGQMYQGGNNSNRKQVIQRYSTDEQQHEQQQRKHVDVVCNQKVIFTSLELACPLVGCN